MSSTLKRCLIILALPFIAIVSSCTPEQQAIYTSLDPASKAAVDAHYRGVIEHARRTAAQGPSLHPFLVCVRRHESDRGAYPHARGYQAQNPRSTASGAYQFLDSTWRNVSARAGHGGYSKARHAPMHVQDAVALYTVNSGGRSAWNGTGC